MSCNEAWIGVAGSLGGVIIGFLLEKISRVGKLKFYDLSVICSYSTYDNEGHQIKEGATKINSAVLRFGIYNSSGNNKIIRNVQLTGFINDRKYFFDTWQINGMNILGKTQNELSFEVTPLNEKGVHSLIEFSLLDKVYFELSYRNNKGKTIKLKIDRIGYSQILAH